MLERGMEKGIGEKREETREEEGEGNLSNVDESNDRKDAGMEVFLPENNAGNPHSDSC